MRTGEDSVLFETAHSVSARQRIYAQKSVATHNRDVDTALRPLSGPIAYPDLTESAYAISCLFQHVLFAKPVSTFAGHALIEFFLDVLNAASQKVLGDLAFG
ncbi:MAG: hypothetical protein WBD53_07820, partial [Xanthobacteraceae bacterium]